MKEKINEIKIKNISNIKIQIIFYKIYKITIKMNNKFDLLKKIPLIIE